MIIHADDWPLQFMQAQGKLQNVCYKKWSTYVQNLIWALNTRRITPITSQIASVGPWLWHSPLFSTLVGTRPLDGHNYIAMIHNRCHIADVDDMQASSKLPPPGCIFVLHGKPLCSFKRACQTNLGGTLQSGSRALWCGEYNGNIATIFLLAKT